MFQHFKVCAAIILLMIVFGRYSHKTEIVYSNTLIEGPGSCGVSIWFRDTYHHQKSLFIPLLYIHEERGRPFTFSVSLTRCDDDISLIKMDNVQLNGSSSRWPYPDGVVSMTLDMKDFINASYEFASPIPNPFLDNEQFDLMFRLRAYSKDGQEYAEKSYVIPVTASRSEGWVNLLFYFLIVAQGV